MELKSMQGLKRSLLVFASCWPLRPPVVKTIYIDVFYSHESSSEAEYVVVVNLWPIWVLPNAFVCRFDCFTLVPDPIYYLNKIIHVR